MTLQVVSLLEIDSLRSLESIGTTNIKEIRAGINPNKKRNDP
jgi:hypothetical protein